jgi:hypothetical protein
MTEQRIRRRLAVILAIDVVGYSRLMGQNEAGALAQLKECRAEVIEPNLDDRFHEGCQKGGIHLRLEAPIYGPVGLGQGVEHHGSVAEGDRVVARR